MKGSWPIWPRHIKEARMIREGKMRQKCMKFDYGRFLSVVTRIFVFILNNSGRRVGVYKSVNMSRCFGNILWGSRSDGNALFSSFWATAS